MDADSWATWTSGGIIIVCSGWIAKSSSLGDGFGTPKAVSGSGGREQKAEAPGSDFGNQLIGESNSRQQLHKADLRRLNAQSAQADFVRLLLRFQSPDGSSAAAAFQWAGE